MQFHNVLTMPTVDNPIGALQELSQARGGRPTPFYVLLSVSGESHCPHFVYEAAWADLRAVGEGSSKVMQIYSSFSAANNDRIEQTDMHILCIQVSVTMFIP